LCDKEGVFFSREKKRGLMDSSCDIQQTSFSFIISIDKRRLTVSVVSSFSFVMITDILVCLNWVSS